MKTRFVSFDGTERCSADFEEPDRYSDLMSAFDDDSPFAVRGSGLSYCLATAAPGVKTISASRFNRILAFDHERRLVTAEPGMTVGDLCDFAASRACYFPVLPGHPSITVGGSAGFNVHGKTQHNVGNFSEHVEALTLFHPDHGEIRCDRSENRDLFDLTLGGMGLTGYIVDLTLRLQPLAGRTIRRIAHRVANVHEAVERMQQLSADAAALYSWNDLNARGPRFGRGVVYEERFEDDVVGDATRYRFLSPESRQRWSAPLWNSFTTASVNRFYLSRKSARREVIRSVHDAAFPINGNEVYFRAFGSRGLREYQMVIGHSAWADASAEIERALDLSGVPAALGSLKLFTGPPHQLWFRAEGVCFTVDVPAVPDAFELFGALDRIAVEHGARVNLAKDSRLAASTVRTLFSEYDAFRDALEAFDPRRRVDSALRRRLDL